MSKRSTVAAAVTAIVVVTAGVGVASCTPEEEPVSPAPSVEQEKKDHAEVNERDDLVSFTLDDRSFSGVDDYWLKWTIKNNSAEKSTYTWDWEAVNKAGERVGSGTEYEDNVLPGQTVKGETPTVLDSPDVKLNVTDFDRSKSW